MHGLFWLVLAFVPCLLLAWHEVVYHPEPWPPVKKPTAGRVHGHPAPLSEPPPPPVLCIVVIRPDPSGARTWRG